MPASTPTLTDMVKDALDRQTLDQLARRAVDPESGERASRGLIYDLSRGEVRRPPTGHLRAIAVALGVPYERVRRAAIAQWLPGDADDPDAGALILEARRLADEAARLADRVEHAAGEQDAPPHAESA